MKTFILLLSLITSLSLKAQLVKKAPNNHGKLQFKLTLIDGGKVPINHKKAGLSLGIPYWAGIGLGYNYNRTFGAEVEFGFHMLDDSIDEKLVTSTKAAIMAHLNKYFSVGYLSQLTFLEHDLLSHGYRLRYQSGDNSNSNRAGIFVEVEGFKNGELKFIPTHLRVGYIKTLY